MNPIVRGIAIYIFLLLVFRVMGKRSLKDTTTFDFVLILIIAETTQQALVGEDFSITSSLILIITLISTDLLLTLIKDKFRFFGKMAEGVPLIIVNKGKPLINRMKKAKVDVEDIMQAARCEQGLERMDQIKYAVLEKDGTISIIPYRNDEKEM